MKKMIKNAIKFVGFMIVCLLEGLYYSVKYVLIGSGIGGRMLILGTYLGIIASLIYKPILFKVIIGVILLIDVICSAYLVKNSGKYTNEDSKQNNSNYEYKQDTYKTYRNPFFDGMSLEEAKKEYRKLMKKYHPDNIDGSLEMTQKITEAYSKFCAASGR